MENTAAFQMTEAIKKLTEAITDLAGSNLILAQAMVEEKDQEGVEEIEITYLDGTPKAEFKGQK